MKFSRRGLLLIIAGVLALIPRAGRTPLAQRLLVPFIVAYLVWQQWDRVLNAGFIRTPPALALAAAGAALNLAGFRWEPAFLEPGGLVLFVIGLAWYYLGTLAMRELAFPASFLVFLIPWQEILIPVLAYPLQRFTAAASAALASATGLHAHCAGVAISLPGFGVTVSPACAGLQALMAFLATGALYANAARSSSAGRWLVFGMALPLALLTNILRVWVILASERFFGPRIAMSFFHEYSGIVLFLMLVLALQAVKTWMERIAPGDGSPPTL